MTTADGRRSNGLPSRDWGALVDLDPRLSDPLLDSLAEQGVPAFVEPTGQLDRLWVDPALAELARGVVSSEVAQVAALLQPGESAADLARPVPLTAAVRVLPPPELPGTSTSPVQPPLGGDPMPSDDELFRQIIAGFSTDVADPVPRWPVSEDVDVPLFTDDPPRRRRSDLVEPAPSENDGLPGWVEPAALEDEGHYVPPPAPKLAWPRTRIVAGVVLVLLGFTALFFPAAVLLDDSGISILGGVVLLFGGVALLLSSMRNAPPTDTGPDDGAVV